jgi:hypothetical protein
MLSRRRVVRVLPGTVCLLAIGIMGWAAFLPFMGIPYYGGGLAGCCQPPLFTERLAALWDARLVIVALPLFAVATAAHLARIRPALTAVTCLSASVGAVLLALFEVTDGGRRILPAWVFPLPSGGPETAMAGVGFYVFVAGAFVAVAASLIMVTTSVRGVRPSMDAPLHPQPS